jgi:hypothetical protein
MPEMSMRDYAAHRGVSLAAVQKAVATSRITIARVEPDGWKRKFIDSDAADQAWELNTNETQRRNATRREMGRGPQNPRKKNSPPLPPEASDEDDADPVHAETLSKNAVGPEGKIYIEARAKKEKFGALTAELEYKKAAGELVPVNKIKVAFANMASTVQQNLLNIPARFSAILAAEYKTAITDLMSQIEDGKTATKSDCLKWIDATSNEKIVSDLMMAEIRNVLTALSNAKF